MAKRRDELIALAAANAAGAKMLILTQIKDFAVHVGPLKEFRDPLGRVVKTTSTIECRCAVAKVPAPIEVQIPVEVGPAFGVFGELDEIINVALSRFRQIIDDKVHEALKAADAPLHPEDRTFADGKQQGSYNRAKTQQSNAARTREKRNAEETIETADAPETSGEVTDA